MIEDDEDDGGLFFEEMIDEWADDESSAVVEAIIKIRYKISFSSDVDKMTLEEVKDAINNDDYEDIMDEEMIEVIEVLTVESY